jgi:hypothetical protein
MTECERSLPILFGHAAEPLESDPQRAREIILGLRLLLAEEFLPAEFRKRLSALETDLHDFNQTSITRDELARRLAGRLVEDRIFRIISETRR